MTSNNIKNLTKRISELERSIASAGYRDSPGLFDAAVLRWGSVPADLLANTEAIPARTLENPFVSAEGLEVANRAARWIATGDQWGA